MTAFESSIAVIANSQARDILITQAITVLSEARREEDENCLAHVALSAVLKYNRPSSGPFRERLSQLFGVACSWSVDGIAARDCIAW
jgi:hypothetical protein